MAADETPQEPQQPADAQPEPDRPAAEEAAVASAVPEPAEGEQPPVAEQPEAAGEQPEAEAEQPAAEQPEAAGEQPAAEGEQPAAEQPETSGEQPTAQQPGAGGEQPAAEGERPQGARKRRNRRRRSGAQAGGDGQQPQQGQQSQGPRPPRRRRPGAPAMSRAQRQKLPLPFNELRSAAHAVSEIHGGRAALRESFAVLGDKERRDISRLVSEDGEWRIRARNIAAGSLGAGRVGKALAAQVVSMAANEDVWAVTLSKEEAAERLARIRNAKRRDERRRERMAERERRTDRLTKDQAQKARDGRVGAQIRIILEDTKDKGRDRRSKKKERRQGTTEDLLSRLGY
jgi:hypothetical protein